MLEVNNIYADIGPTQILRSVNLNVTAGSMCGLIGRNGAGKTTVMRTIMGLLTARNGTILLDGEDLVGQFAMGWPASPHSKHFIPGRTPITAWLDRVD